MKSILIVLLFVFSTYVACAGDCTPESNPNHEFQSWMSPFGHRAFKDILLLASHDAGTYPYHSKSKNTEWFVTQSQNIGSQLCSSYRMFDLRVKSAKTLVPIMASTAKDCSPEDEDAAGTVNKFGSWRVYHEDSHFDCVHRIAAQIKTFCTSHPTEVAIFRLKMESADSDKKDRFYEALAEKIGNCIVKSELLSKVANLQDATLNQILNATVGRSLESPVATGGVILLDYSKKEKLRDDSQAARIIFNYAEFQMGEFSNSLDFEDIQNAQHEKYTEWTQLAAPTPPLTKPTFGWWTTFTSVSSDVMKSVKNLVDRHTTMNVEENTGAIFTGGAHANWVLDWVNDRVANKETVKGVTLWTDFAGDPRQTEIVRLAAKINCNLSNNITANADLGTARDRNTSCTHPTKNRFHAAKKVRHSHRLKMSSKKCNNKKCHHHKK